MNTFGRNVCFQDNFVKSIYFLQLPLITTRGVQLAALFMRGVEAAIFANDACGAPLPWAMTCPWNFFDGKLFHYKLLKANNNCSLLELCDGHVSTILVASQSILLHQGKP